MDPEDFDLDDFDLKDFIDNEDYSGPDIASMSPRELEEYVLKHGVVPNGKGGMLVACSNNPNPAFCGLYKGPSGEGGEQLDCTGPLNTAGNNVLCRYGSSEKYRQY